MLECIQDRAFLPLTIGVIFAFGNGVMCDVRLQARVIRDWNCNGVQSAYEHREVGIPFLMFVCPVIIKLYIIQ